MCKTIHTKGGVVSKHKSKHTSIVETTLSYVKDMWDDIWHVCNIAAYSKISPTKTSD